jgi:homoserine O-acetyltransferase/O-succinyltransferase
MAADEGAAREYVLGDVSLISGAVLRDARIVYKTYGELNLARDNVVVLPTFYTGTHARNEGFFGAGRAIDPARHFIVSVNMFGNAVSSSPSNAHQSCSAADFPGVSLYDNIACQYRLLSECLRVEALALVAGWSMAGCQAFQWAVQYPHFVKAIVPFCGSARVSVHNHVFLEGVKAALQADQAFAAGNYSTQPVTGLKAFGRVYAGWAYSQTFFRDGLYRRLGYANAEALLCAWEQDHAHNWDANDLLAMLWTWQHADVSLNTGFNGDLAVALASIEAKSIVIACSDDLYFPPADSALEVAAMRNAQLRVFDSPWGHCVASPGNEPRFHEFLDTAFAEVLN